MATFEDGSYQCLPGPALIAKVLAGRCRMKYTRAAVGQGTIPADVSPKSLTEPPDYVMDAKIAAVTNPVDGECQVTVQINSSDVKSGFYAMGILLYAEDSDLGEVPYTYLKLEEGLEWIRPASSAVGKLATFDLIAAVGAVDVVSANIDPDAIVTYAAVEQLIANATVVTDISIPTSGWVASDEDEPGAVRVEIPILGMTANMKLFMDVYPAYVDVARPCGMGLRSVRTMDDKLRVYAEAAPTKELLASLTLLCSHTNGISNSPEGTGYVLPTATATRLGGVKASDSVLVDADGTAHAVLDADSFATQAEVDAAIRDVFGE